jgi:pimeloyl-ACP methyl ester carboxylesterase
MDAIESRDGTPIACQRTGAGPPLVLVHGMLGTSRRWPILPLLEQQVTVCAIDRRGRGESGDAAHYAVEREFEDVAAVARANGGEVSLLGHSFGGMIALEAARLIPGVRRVIAYEPSPDPIPPGAVDRLRALLDARDREGLVIAFLREVVRMPPGEVEMFKVSPIYPAMLAAAHTVPRELAVEESYRLDAARFQNLRAPVLLLLGGDSPPQGRATVEAWHSILPNSRIAVLPGQRHSAHYTAPDLFAREVLAFLAGPDL